MNPAEEITLREYLEQALWATETRLLQQLAAGEKALTLQATEYERRLTALNHAHDQAREKERDFLSRETHDLYARSTSARLSKIEQTGATVVDRDRIDALLQGVEVRFEEVGARLAEIERVRANLDGRFSMLALVLTGGSIILNILVALATHVVIH